MSIFSCSSQSKRSDKQVQDVYKLIELLRHSEHGRRKCYAGRVKDDETDRFTIPYVGDGSISADVAERERRQCWELLDRFVLFDRLVIHCHRATMHLPFFPGIDTEQRSTREFSSGYSSLIYS
jgi:hypothetical protein